MNKYNETNLLYPENAFKYLVEKKAVWNIKTRLFEYLEI